MSEAYEGMREHFFILNIICSFTIVFLQRRNPKAAWAWIFLVNFVPGLGILIYLMFGQDFHKKKIFRAKEIEGEVEYSAVRQEKRIYRKQVSFRDKKLDEYKSLVLYNLKSGRTMLTDNNDIQIFTEGQDKFRALISEIEKARKYVYIQYYIIRKDELWDEIADILIKKVRKGVEVRVLFDSMGCRTTARTEWERLRKEGIRVAEFFPAVFGRLQLRVNYRNHRKIVVIDGRVGFVGGFNVGKEYVGCSERFGHWRDTHICIEGGAVISLAVRFVMDWNYAAGENLFLRDELFEMPEYTQNGKVPVQIISSGPDSKFPEIRNNYLRLIQMAKRTIRIQTPYFIPDDNIKDALVIASKSGVDVQLMIPCMPDHPFVYWATYSYMGEMLEAGVKCYLYSDGFLHAKCVCADGMVSCLGTANMDIRSFSLNFEVNAVIYNQEKTQELERAFDNDIIKSRQITLEEYEKRGIEIRMKEQFCRLLSPVL